MRLRRNSSLVIVLAAAMMVFGAVTARAADSAIPQITRLNAALLETMKAATKLGYQGRYKKLFPVIKATYDLNFMTRYSAGRHWRDLTDAQRKKLIDAFTRLTVATYAERFDGYSGETFKITSEETPRAGTRLVHSELIKSDGEPVKLNYLMRKTKEGWQVIDVFLKGTISELATKRSEYSSTLENKGFDGLMAIFEQKISHLNAAKS